MPIRHILDLFPDSAQVLLGEGLHCIGCDANLEESLEQGAKAHGFSEERITKIMSRLNELYQAQKTTHTKKPEEKDFSVEEVQEGNKKYFSLAGMLFSEKAYRALHELATAKGLRLRIDAGGCSGYTYHYDFKDQPGEDEKTYTLSDSLDIYMNDFSFDKLHGSIVNFESGLHGAGLQFFNPNTKKTCSCGSSVGF